jgi:hypothetical protein
MDKEQISSIKQKYFKTNAIGNSFWKSIDWEERIDLNYYSKSINLENK